MSIKLQPNRSILKYKALRLITPELANSLGLPAEAPVFSSPYITRKGVCNECRVSYEPLVYQVGMTTKAHHFCKNNGGGIYVYDPLSMDRSGAQWVYRTGLWQAVVVPSGPIRMGHDKGYTFRSIRPKYICYPACIRCDRQVVNGRLYSSSYNENDLVPICDLHAGLGLGSGQETDWTFAFELGTNASDTTFHIRKAMSTTIPEGVKIFL